MIMTHQPDTHRTTGGPDASRARRFTPPRARHWRRAFAAALVLCGCGGGVETGGTGTAYVNGSITGFGSIVVGAVRFDDSRALVTDGEGATRSRDDLRLGMTTEVRGSALTTDVTGATISTASSIAFGGDIVGPVEAIDATTRRLTVLGQGVDVDASTVFDDATLASGFASLAVGNVVEVYALLDTATGRYSATRIERKSGAAAYRLRGAVARLDATARTFAIGSATISYATDTGSFSSGLANGSLVRVRLQTTKVGGAWPVARLDDGRQKPGDNEEARIEGRVDLLSDATHFRVNGVAVDASRIGATAGLALGVRVEVEGTTAADVLIASKVSLRSSGQVQSEGFEVRGAVASVDLANQRFVVRGVTISYAAGTTDFRNGTASNLAVGASVEARGVLSADGTRLVATRITFK
jgi:Domain of unknown function (DUF5666)